MIGLVVLGVLVVLLVGRGRGAAPVADEGTAAVAPTGDANELLQRVKNGDLLTAADLELVRFDSGVRGYRMDQVDALLEALTLQLKESQSDQ